MKTNGHKRPGWGWGSRAAICGAMLVGLVLAGVAPAGQPPGWPPAEPLKAAAAGDDAAPLPPSIAAEAVGKGTWKCVFRFRPAEGAKRVVLVGSFNNWDRDANPMLGPDAAGEWSAALELPAGVHQYKFLVNNADWLSDPRNPDQVPDSFGKQNSVLRLGSLTRMRVSEAKVGDGQIGVAGLSHDPAQAMYMQVMKPDELSIRYRTFSHDVEHVWLAVKDGPQVEMKPAATGPLVTYWEASVPIPGGAPKRESKIRGITYTFVLQDGGEKVCDPYTPYYYTVAAGNQLVTPDWARSAVWYQIVPDRFRNGDPGNDHSPVRPWTSEWFTPSPWEGQDGQTFYASYSQDRYYGGDLAGLESQLPYLKELGVNALHLTPVFQALSYHKYDVQSYVHIADDFGTRGGYEKVAAQEDVLNPGSWQWTDTDQRFLAFVKKAHSMGFKVLLDAVFHHVGDQHPAFQDVLKNGKRSRYADWFAVTSWEPFGYRGWAGYAHMPMFATGRYGFASKTLQQHLFAVTRRWMDPNGDGDPSDGIDGWRVDAAKEIPATFWAEWRKTVKDINPQALIVGEVWQRADDWLTGDHFDSVGNYEFARTVVAWVFDRQQKITASEAASRYAELQLAYPEAASHVLQNLIDNHDTDRLASMAQNPDREYDRQNRVQDNNPSYDNSKPSAESYARARLATLLQMTGVGAPLVYYGDEVGMWGADDPTNRKPMLWKDLQPYEKPEENAVMEDHLAFYQQAIALRNTHAALRTGTFRTLLADDQADVWAFVRSDPQVHVLVILNASSSPHDVRIPVTADLPPSWTTLLGGEGPAAATDGALTIHVNGLAGVVLSAPAK